MGGRQSWPLGTVGNIHWKETHVYQLLHDDHEDHDDEDDHEDHDGVAGLTSALLLLQAGHR